MNTLYAIKLNKGISKVIFDILLIFIFSLIYMMFENEDFGGYVTIESDMYYRMLKERKLTNIFILYTDKDKYLQKNEFIKIPIVKKGTKLIYTDKEPENEKEYNKKLKAALFDVYSTDGKIDIDIFKRMPIISETDYDENDPFLYVDRPYRKYSVNGYFDRLYYSVVVQTTLGFGDIFPNTKALRITTMCQVITTILFFLL